jgi:hypothetical protein
MRPRPVVSATPCSIHIRLPVLLAIAHRVGFAADFVPHRQPISVPLPSVRAVGKVHRSSLLLLPLPRQAPGLFGRHRCESIEPLRAPPLRVHRELAPRRVLESIDSVHRFLLWKIILYSVKSPKYLDRSSYILF